MKINNAHRILIRKLYYKNEQLMDSNRIEHEEYLSNINILLRKVRLSILTSKEKLILIDATSAE